MGYPGLELGNSGRNTLPCSVRSDHYRIKEAGPLIGKSLHMHMWLRPRSVLRRAPSRHKAVGSLVLSDAGISDVFRGQGAASMARNEFLLVRGLLLLCTLLRLGYRNLL